ncbi:UNVERIFIED_ORG: hypothetical protein ABIC43_000978 [Variovorax guangxiensis]
MINHMESSTQLAGHRFDLSKSVLYLSALGLFAKLLKADVSGVLLPGVTLKAEHAAWAAGLIGMVLLFTLLALVISILEDAYDGLLSGKVQREGHKLLKNPVALVSLAVLGGLSAFVYMAPLVLGVYASSKLWADTASTCAALWRVL